MTKPDYSQMTRKQLKEYLLINRDDRAGWAVFFQQLNQLDRSKCYPAPHKMKSEELEEIFRSQVEEREQ